MTKIGTYVLDTRSNRIGEVMDHLNGHLQLRPIGGGVEWDCPPTDTELPTREALLSERLRTRNRNTHARGKLNP
ncbi:MULTISPECIES: hypothetical protein [unclassified Streptomyces]|uniref:Uncharacterized protein n=1 Tax=Streptomyces niveiscabiei TaxID=164115 RepID=A0ABW9HK15_9ACTN|nr:MULTISPECIES: hypothetical protein [unclassified Streptomyces]QZZ28557.1 hypothetical protein A7X85_21785 [Streptomyces sp. ST1015]